MASLTGTRVLVLGASGMLGHKLAQVLAADGDMVVDAAARVALPPAARQPGVTYHEVPDLASGAVPLARLIDTAGPDVIVNAVGAIKQRDLDSHVESTFFINGVLPHLLAQLASSRGLRIIHFSTDCVFKGDRGGYTELDRPDVEDLYGRSKAIGEVDYGRHLTIRTSIVGFELTGHRGLMGWFLSQPRGAVLKGFTKAIFSGLPTVTLAKIVRDIIVGRPHLSGLYHVASDPIDKFALLSLVNDALDLQYRLEPTDELQIDRSLDDTRFRLATQTARPGWTQLVQELAADYHTGIYPQIYEQVYA